MKDLRENGKAEKFDDGKNVTAPLTSGGYVTVKDCSKLLNCGKHVARRTLKMCPSCCIHAGKLQAPLAEVEQYIASEIARQRTEAPDLVPVL